MTHEGVLWAWCLGLWVVALVLFQTPAGPLGIPIAIAGGVFAYKALHEQ